MNLFQSLFVLAAGILIVWWALRRSAENSAKEAPTSHGHEEHADHSVHSQHVEAEQFEVLPPEPELEIIPEPTPVAEYEPAPVPPAEPVVVAERAPEPVTLPQTEVKLDDLVIIEGIGPRISGVLKSNGVKTFAQLAAMQPAEIKAILNSVDERLGRISDPTTWPEQAALAAKGDLEGLQALQDSLKGGRHA